MAPNSLLLRFFIGWPLVIIKITAFKQALTPAAMPTSVIIEGNEACPRGYHAAAARQRHMPGTSKLDSTTNSAVVGAKNVSAQNDGARSCKVALIGFGTV